MSYRSIEEIQKRCTKEGIEFWKAIQLETFNGNLEKFNQEYGNCLGRFNYSINL